MDTIFNMLEEIKPEQNFKSSDDFVADGLLDSFDIISLVSMLEEHYHITIDGLDIVPEYFVSVDAMKKLVEKSGGGIDGERFLNRSASSRRLLMPSETDFKVCFLFATPYPCCAVSRRCVE